MTRFYLDTRGGRVVVTTRKPVLPPPVWYRTLTHAEAIAERLNEGLPAEAELAEPEQQVAS